VEPATATAPPAAETDATRHVFDSGGDSAAQPELRYQETTVDAGARTGIAGRRHAQVATG